MDKKIWIRAALPAFLFGLCMICPQMQVSAVNAKTGVTSVGSIVYEDSAGCAAIYAEDIACLKEKLSSVRAEVYNPDYYGNVRRWEYEILPENEVPKVEYPALPEEVKEPEETLMPEDEKMPVPDETTALSEEVNEPGETEAREPEETLMPEDEKMPVPDETTALSEEVNEPGETEAREPAQAPVPEDTETAEQEKPSAPEDTEDKGGAENQ